MRKNSARKWLHAILDLLPVVLIPVFMVYSHRHQIDSYEIQYAQNEVIDFNQQSNFEYEISGNDSVFLVPYYNNNDNYNHKYIFKTNYGFNSLQLWVGNDNADNTWSSGITATGQHLGAYDFVNTTVVQIPKLHIFIRTYPVANYLDTYGNVTIKLQVFDLTQMFGAGNEPTASEFDSYFPNAYYDYILSHRELLKVGDVVYNDTDIGSQFFYCLYNSVDKYFNVGNVFNLGSIYDWLNLNIFNGNSPLAIYIVWNIVAYEFLMDLLFLLYGLFMFFIDTCTNLMDRFYCTLSGRR